MCHTCVVLVTHASKSILFSVLDFSFLLTEVMSPFCIYVEVFAAISFESGSVLEERF